MPFRHPVESSEKKKKVKKLARRRSEKEQEACPRMVVCGKNESTQLKIFREGKTG